MSIGIGVHSHSISGTTTNIGSKAAINIEN
ncbi:hypothetical protein [Photorhabdus noenieputensis]